MDIYILLIIDKTKRTMYIHPPPVQATRFTPAGDQHSSIWFLFLQSMHTGMCISTVYVYQHTNMYGCINVIQLRMAAVAKPHFY